MAIELPHLQRYLEERTSRQVQIEEVRPLGGEATGREALKQFGYGRPLQISFRSGERKKKWVLHSVRRSAFGRERADDRAAAIWLDYRTFNRLPRHVPAIDMVIQDQDGSLHSIASAEELLLVTRYSPGNPYAEDLLRIRDEGMLSPIDMQRAETLAEYLAEIHKTKHEDPLLWRRRLRDLIGNGEGIMGITDSYPLDETFVEESQLREIEELANLWRWRLKPKEHRLSQVHGDFHPFNVLFDEGVEFHLLDRSRGEWGEPADDVSCMTINYLFFSMQRYGRLEGPFQQLHDHFWQSYLEGRQDEELLRVIQPWFTWRALVVASPVWYPTIAEEVRRKLLTFARLVLLSEEFDYKHVNNYLEEA